MFNISNTSQCSTAVAEGKTTSTDETAVVSNVKALFEIFWTDLVKEQNQKKSFSCFISGRRIFFTASEVWNVTSHVLMIWTVLFKQPVSWNVC